MKVEVTAIIKEIGQAESLGSSGFQKRNLILTEQNGDYENIFCIEFSGEKLDLPCKYQLGQLVSVQAFVNCREWEGRYFTSLKGVYVSASQAQQQAPSQPQQQYQQPQTQPVNNGGYAQQYQPPPVQNQQPVQQNLDDNIPF
jgi:hypothetical protein